MFIGMGMPIPDLSNLPGPSRPGGGGGGAFEYTAIDNSFSMEFDGAQSYFQGSDITSLDNASAFSISFWFKPNALNVNHRIMSKYTDSNQRTTLSLFSTSFSINISRNGLRTGTTGYPNENPIPWKHIGIIFDGTKSTNAEKLICLFDGLPQTLTFAQGALPSQTANTAGKTFNIGALDTGTSILNPVNGKLDEVAVWGGTALSQDTMKAIYDATVNNPGKVADLSETPEGAPTAWYRMGD
jgi:hypothetical protein